MEQKVLQTNYELLTVVVRYGSGSKVLKLAKSTGVKGGTIFLGRGTVEDRILTILGIHDIRKEIVLMVTDSETSLRCMPYIEEKMKLKIKKHGIAFSTPVNYFCGSVNKEKLKNKSEGISMYNCIYVIVDKGRSSEVVDAANKAGSKGCTIINARGSGIHETSKVFSIEIEPQKEIIMILAELEITDQIIESIKKDLELEKPGNGILFVQKVNNTYGMKRPQIEKA